MSQIQEVKQATDIIQILGERLQLTRSGTNWRALCPFHSEKSPSFFINEQLQRYKCFGCGESGDVFTFLEKYEGMTFAETLQYLADRAGITLIQQSFTSEDDQRKRLLEILNLTKEYYHYLLTKHKAGAAAREYLKNRGISADSIKIFQLGYALPSWDGLLSYLHQKKKYAVADLQAAGLIIPGSGGRPYDRFRDRLMFPLTDHRGRVVGFSGRTLDPAAKEAKYINSPETMLYHKSQMLFGYSQLYQSLRQANEAVIVEGEFDVISSAQAHVNNVVAVKGSALTEEHMKLLSRTVAKIILSFDMDAAGITATKRAIEVAKPFNVELRVIDARLASGEKTKKKDPDELARTQPQLWREMVKSSTSVYDFLIHATVQQYDVDTPEGKRHIIDELAPFLGNISHAVESEFYVDKLAAILQVNKQVVKSDLQKFRNIKKHGVPVRKIEKEKVDKPKALTRKTRLENYAVFLLFHLPSEKVHDHAEQLKHVHFARAGLKQIIEHVLKWSGTFELQKFSSSLADDLQQILLDATLDKEALDLLPELNIEKEWQKVVPELIDLDVGEEIARITQELDELDQKAQRSPQDEVEQQQLLQRIVQLRSRKSPR